MRVLVTATTFPRWPGDAVPYFVHDLCLEYRKQGHDVYVLAPHHPGARLVEDMAGMHVVRFPYFLPLSRQRVAYDGGIPGNLAGSKLAVAQVPFFLISSVLWMLYLVMVKRIRVIHSHWMISQGLVASIVSLLTPAGHVCTVHAADLALLERLPLSRWIAAFVLRNTGKVVFVSSHGLRRTARISGRPLTPERVEVIPMGVDPASFAAGSRVLPEGDGETEAGTVLFVGRFADKKGIPYLLDAFSRLHETHPGVRLVLAGDGPGRADLEQQARELGIAGAVEFPGFVTGPPKVECFERADILVVPSIETPGGDVEGLPVVILEGMAAGLCVVSTDTGGIADVVADGVNGILVPQRDSQALYKTLRRLLEDPSLRAGLGRAARATAARYDWGVIGRRYLGVLEQVAGCPR